MIKILFICLGNICRSPMAEFLFKDMVAKRGWQINSILHLRLQAVMKSAILSIPARAINLHSTALVLPVKLPCSLLKQIMINMTTL